LRRRGVPDGVEQLDYEVELAVIIGRAAKKVAPRKPGSTSPDTASSTTCPAVASSVINNGSAASLRYVRACARAGDTGRGAGSHSLQLTCKVNGELRQNSNTTSSSTVEDIIAHITRGITLRGDVISTGRLRSGRVLQASAAVKRGDVWKRKSRIGQAVNKVVDRSLVIGQ